MNTHVQHVAGRARGELDAATLRMEVDPQNLLEEVEAQLRIGGSWMTEGGVKARCRLARNLAQVVGALIELERQGRVLSKDRDTRLALWRAGRADGLPKIESSGLSPTVTKFTQLPESPAPALSPPDPVATTPHDEVTMNRIDRATPILELLRAGPLSFDDICTKTTFSNKQVSQALFALKAKNLVRKNAEKQYERTSGAAIPTRKKSAHAPPPRALPTCATRERRGPALVPWQRRLGALRRAQLDHRAERGAVRHDPARALGDPRGRSGGGLIA